MDEANHKIEQQMTMLLRRVQSIHLSTATGEMFLERSAYGILCQLADEGPQRLGSVATAFGLDPSTITRQVKALEDAGLVARETDPTDRRAAILDLTFEGSGALERTRQYRRRRLFEAMADWPAGERDEFGRLLERFNHTIDKLAHEG